ncbi:MAG: sulfotransferase, partial [Kiloniellales bacterium]
MSEPIRPPDVLYIGYSRSGSTFIRQFLERHPDIYWDRRAHAYLVDPDKVVIADSEASRIEAAKVYVSMSEKMCESLAFKDRQRWRECQWRPNAWDDLQGDVEVRPEHNATALKALFPASRALIVIRDQRDWLDSLYRMYIDRLPPGRRSFVDFCATPRGAVLLRAAMYDVTIEAYLAGFGADNLKVLRYERLRDDRAGFLADLCTFLGVLPMPFDAPPANVGRDLAATRLHRHLPTARHAPDGLKQLAHRLLRSRAGVKPAALSTEDCRFLEAY